MSSAFAAFVVASLLCFDSPAIAMTFGEVHDATRLGQPLDFQVVVKLDAGEALSPHCVAAQVKAGDSRISPNRVRISLAGRASPGEALLRIATTSRVKEPVVTLQVSLGCPPSVSHRFVSLLDPPPVPGGRPSAVMGEPQQAHGAPMAAFNDAVASAGAAEEVSAPREADDVLVLKERLDRLQQEHQATQQAVAELQAGLREARQARPADSWLYGGLGMLALSIAAAVGVLLWRVRSERAWLDGAQALTDARLPPGPAHAAVRSTTSPGDVSPAAVRTAPPSVSAMYGPSPARSQGALTGEELIDLEQQADFFVALGEVDAAIDLLMSHVRNSGGTSPTPYLKLLEIYRRRGDRDAYDRLRERFNRRFNGRAPGWDQGTAGERALEGYPEAVARLQAAWTVPARASDLLEVLLFQRHETQEVFDLPAYEELLFLYALARDLVEQESRRVDLLLPLGASDETPAIIFAEATRPQRRPSVRVDVELDIEAPRFAPPTA